MSSRGVGKRTASGGRLPLGSHGKNRKQKQPTTPEKQKTKTKKIKTTNENQHHVEENNIVFLGGASSVFAKKSSIFSIGTRQNLLSIKTAQAYNTFTDWTEFIYTAYQYNTTHYKTVKNHTIRIDDNEVAKTFLESKLQQQIETTQDNNTQIGGSPKKVNLVLSELTRFAYYREFVRAVIESFVSGNPNEFVGTDSNHYYKSILEIFDCIIDVVNESTSKPGSVKVKIELQSKGKKSTEDDIHILNVVKHLAERKARNCIWKTRGVKGVTIHTIQADIENSNSLLQTITKDFKSPSSSTGSQ
jgi:hypothetical protein